LCVNVILKRIQDDIVPVSKTMYYKQINNILDILKRASATLQLNLILLSI